MKVISFSAWGRDPAFYQGALANVELAKKIYPDWTCWFFVDHDTPLSMVTPLIDNGAMVYWRSIMSGPWEGLFWRFEPISDPFVTHTIVRDCDSRVNPREAAAVAQWLASGKMFHVMRDHYEHNVPIMGGMFGSLHWPLMETFMKEWKDFGSKGCDQRFLAERVWPTVKRSTIGHDRYAQGLSMPNRDGVGTYEYKPLEQLGDHDLRFFPDHDIFDPVVFGEHVGARVGI